VTRECSDRQNHIQAGKNIQTGTQIEMTLLIKKELAEGQLYKRQEKH
jgi:hypothetical protein